MVLYRGMGDRVSQRPTRTSSSMRPMPGVSPAAVCLAAYDVLY